MKLVNTNKDSWMEIDKIVLVVNSIDVDYSEKLSVNLSCNFENISKGRCKVRINEKTKKSSNSLSIFTDQALMIVDIKYDYVEIEKLVNFMILNKNNKKKIKAYIAIIENLMGNDSGCLFVNKDMEVNSKSISWNIPII